MKDRHILEILDETSFAALQSDELQSVQAHCAACADCRRALDAARVSSALLTVRASLPAAEPSAFFQSKVLVALREKQNLRKPIEAFRRWWQAAFPLVCSMLFLVITLALLTVLAPKAPTEQAVSTYNLYSTDAVILDQTQPARSITTEQALEVIYTERRDPVKR